MAIVWPDLPGLYTRYKNPVLKRIRWYAIGSYQSIITERSSSAIYEQVFLYGPQKKRPLEKNESRHEVLKGK